MIKDRLETSKDRINDINKTFANKIVDNELEDDVLKHYAQQRETKNRTEPTRLIKQRYTRNYIFRAPTDENLTSLEMMRQIYRPDLIGDIKGKVPNLKLNSKFLNIRCFLENKLKLKKVQQAFDANTKIHPEEEVVDVSIFINNYY